MTATVAARDDLRRMLAEDGLAGRGDTFRCPSPSHEDRHPSAQVFDDDRGGHLHCFACGYHATAVEYLMQQRGMSMRQALEELGLSEMHSQTARRPPSARASSPRATQGCGSRRPLKALPEGILKRHIARVEATFRVPPALSGRGFQREDIATLLLAEGNNGAGLFPIYGPHRELLNVKRRLAEKRDGQRYVYEVAGNGSPAWCSPGILDCGELLIVEGELNAMISWLVRPDLGVMGPAGANGCLHLEPLKGRAVHIYADKDEAGDKARQRWTEQAQAAGAARVYIIDPWPDGDACDVAGRLSRQHLKDRLS